MRWARISLCALVASTAFLVPAVPAVAVLSHEATTARQNSPAPVLALSAQTPWVTPAAPWFSLSVGVARRAGPVGALHVALTFYGRIEDESELVQSTNATPDEGTIGHSDTAVTATPSGDLAAACVTVLPDANASAPTPGPGTSGVCPAGAPTVELDCTPGRGTCGDVYPVSVALLRQGDSSPLARFTTFLTYQEPGLSSSDGAGGPLRVSLIMPVSTGLSPSRSSPSPAALDPVEGLAGVSHHILGCPSHLP